MNAAPLILSFEVATAATLFAGLVGVGLAGLMSRTRFFGHQLLDVLITAPMVLPPTVLGYYLLQALGRSSLLGRTYEHLFGAPVLFTPVAAVVASTLAALPFVVKSARAAMEEVDPRLIGAAQTLGASPARVFFHIVLPLSWGGVLAGLTLGFARAVGEFGVTLMLAGNIPGLTQTASLAIYDLIQANRDAEAAGMVAVLTSLVVAALWAVAHLTRKKRHAF